MTYRKLFLTFLASILCSFLSQAQSNADSLASVKIAFDNKKNEPVYYSYYDSASGALNVHYKTRDLVFEKPHTLGFVRNLPDDMWQIAKSPFQKKNLKWLGLTAAATIILIPYDQRITDGVKNFSVNMHLDADTRYGILLKAGQTKLVKYPQNINSAMYQLGEGGTSMLLAAGLWMYGKTTSDNRALQTASDLTETFFIMGVSTQILKRSFGRQSPFMATKPGGAWHPFPSFKDFQVNTSNYDAFPSGHLSTMMATVTVIAMNYPEKKWIKPLGYALTGLTGWAMINTDVHWIGDYPLALALGYLSGKISAIRHEKKPVKKEITF